MRDDALACEASNVTRRATVLVLADDAELTERVCEAFARTVEAPNRSGLACRVDFDSDRVRKILMEEAKKAARRKRESVARAGFARAPTAAELSEAMAMQHEAEKAAEAENAPAELTAQQQHALALREREARGAEAYRRRWVASRAGRADAAAMEAAASAPVHTADDSDDDDDLEALDAQMGGAA